MGSCSLNWKNENFLSVKNLLVPFAKSFLTNAKSYMVNFRVFIIFFVIKNVCKTRKYFFLPTLENLNSQALISGPAHQPGHRDGGGGGSGQCGRRLGQDDSHPCGRAQVPRDRPSKIPLKIWSKKVRGYIRDGGGDGSRQRGRRPGQDDSHPCGRAQVPRDRPSKIPGKMWSKR